MTIQEVRLLGDLNVLALTIWGESRGEPIESKVAVGCVVRNRLTQRPTRFGSSFADVCLARKQFSCWWIIGGKANYEALMAVAQTIADCQTFKDPAYRECRYIATGIITGEIRDNTATATHYVTRSLYEGHPPQWVKEAPLVAHVGAHVFMVA